MPFARGRTESRTGALRDATSTRTSTTTRWATRRRMHSVFGSSPRPDCRARDTQRVRSFLVPSAARCERDEHLERRSSNVEVVSRDRGRRRDARRAEALKYDTRARRELRTDPESALLAFELRASAIGDEIGVREERLVRRDRGVRAAHRTALG